MAIPEALKEAMGIVENAVVMSEEEKGINTKDGIVSRGRAFQELLLGLNRVLRKYAKGMTLEEHQDFQSWLSEIAERIEALTD